MKAEKTRILLVEDDSLIAEDIKVIVENFGYSILWIASTARAAIENADKFKPDLIMMDIVLDGEMDGIEAAEKIKARVDIPIVYLTAHADENTLERAKKTEPYGYVLKPFQEQELKTVIDTALYKHGMERKVKESEERYRTLIEGSLQGVGVTQDFRIVFANQAFAEIFGYCIDEMLKLTQEKMKRLIHPEDRELVWNRFRDRLEGKDVPSRYEFRCIRKDGSMRWLEMFASRIAYNGKPAIQGAIVDITERKQAEEVLRKTDEKLKEFIELAPDGIVTLDRKGIITSCNSVTVDSTGYSKKEIIGKHFSSLPFLRLNDIPEYTRMFTSLIRGKIPQPFEVGWTAKNGTEKWSEIHLGMIRENGKNVGVQVISRDITERRQSEKKIELLANILDTSPFSVIAADNDEKIVYVNPATEKLFGYEKNELIGENPIVLNADPDADKIQKEIVDTIKRGGVWRGEILNKKKNGCVFPISASVYRLFDKKGDLIALVGFQEDISERKKVEEILKESERKYRELVENIDDVLYSVDDKGNITYISPKIKDVIGYAPDEVIGKNYSKFVHPEDKSRIMQNFKEAREGNLTQHEYRVISKSKGTIWVRAHSRPVFEGKKYAGLRGVLTDITKYKQDV
jgi:PAS domain S-box-containing protein